MKFRNLERPDGQMSRWGRGHNGYEIEGMDVWHRRRCSNPNPELQDFGKSGRSRTTFDDMVRLDLRYSRTCSPISDLKILLQTPRAYFRETARTNAHAQFSQMFLYYTEPPIPPLCMRNINPQSK